MNKALVMKVPLIALFSVCFISPLYAAGPVATHPQSNPLEQLSRVHAETKIAIDEARSRSDHELWQHHLDSTLSLLEVDIARVRLGYDLRSETEAPSSSSQSLIDQSVKFHQEILNGLKGDAGQPEHHFGEGLSLIMAYVSRLDRSVQYYSLVLPKDWDPTQSYPLLVTLHGYGRYHPLGYVEIHFPSERRARTVEANTPPQTQEWYSHILIRPWGRGNIGYMGSGEIDVHEAVSDIARRVRTDKNRWYLSGFSMGGGGSWHIAIHRPDLWAAVAPLASAYSYIGVDNPTVQNLEQIPFYFQIGEEDVRRVPLTRERSQAVKNLGNETQVEIIPGVGHNIPVEFKRKAWQWMFQFEKQVPDSFTYQIDPTLSLIDLMHSIKPWGINPRVREYGKPADFSFRISRDQNTIHLETNNISHIKFDPEPLQIGPTLTVIANEIEVYKGGAEPVDLDITD